MIGYKNGSPNTDNKKTERPGKISSKLIPAATARAKKDIQQWRSALVAAENVTNPKRSLLYAIYKEILIDADIISEIGKRKDQLNACEFELINDQDVADPDKTKLLNTTWFNELIEYALESKFWGHSLVDIAEFDQTGMITKVELVKREHVKPEIGIIVTNVSDDKGMNFREDQSIVPYVFEFGKPDDLGLLNNCVPHALYARFAQAAWSEFCEIFAMPLRVVHTNTKDNENLRRVEQMMIDMATASFAILDTEEVIKFIEAAKADGNVFDGLIKLCANKIIKIINKSIIGENTGGGSLAKEQVGLLIQQVVLQTDKKFITDYVNEQVIPKLIALGYPIQGLRFAYKKTKDIKALLELVKELSNAGYEIDIEWMKENFNVPIIGKKSDPNLKGVGDLDFF